VPAPEVIGDKKRGLRRGSTFYFKHGCWGLSALFIAGINNTNTAFLYHFAECLTPPDRMNHRVLAAKRRLEMQLGADGFCLRDPVGTCCIHARLREFTKSGIILSGRCEAFCLMMELLRHLEMWLKGAIHRRRRQPLLPRQNA
jgi:hypothetical protein